MSWEQERYNFLRFLEYGVVRTGRPYYDYIVGLMLGGRFVREYFVEVLLSSLPPRRYTRQSGSIYVLLTDVGFVNEPNFVWETLNNIDGDSQFVDAEFKVVIESSSSLSPTGTSTGSIPFTPSAPVYPTQMDLA
ncbi:hypothetical protein ACTXT7_002879 [Hymenolepis weldensis]